MRVVIKKNGAGVHPAPFFFQDCSCENGRPLEHSPTAFSWPLPKRAKRLREFSHDLFEDFVSPEAFGASSLRTEGLSAFRNPSRFRLFLRERSYF